MALATVLLDYKEEPKIKFLAGTCYRVCFSSIQLAGWLPSLFELVGKQQGGPYVSNQ